MLASTAVTTRSAGPTVSVVIPAYNEADNVGELLRRLAESLPTGAEVLLVDDSTDDTATRAHAAARFLPVTLTVIHRDEPAGGLGGAVVAGLRAARAEWAVVMDGDLQHPPAVVADLLAAAARPRRRRRHPLRRRRRRVRPRLPVPPRGLARRDGARRAGARRCRGADERLAHRLLRGPPGRARPRRRLGDGAHRREYELLAGASRTVLFTGRISDDDLHRAYDTHDVVVVPSVTRAEAFGLVVLEGMAAGCVPVVFDLPGVRDLVADAGLVVPPRDTDALAAALDGLAADRARLASLGHRRPRRRQRRPGPRGEPRAGRLAPRRPPRGADRRGPGPGGDPALDDRARAPGRTGRRGREPGARPTSRTPTGTAQSDRWSRQLRAGVRRRGLVPRVRGPALRAGLGDRRGVVWPGRRRRVNRPGRRWPALPTARR